MNTIQKRQLLHARRTHKKKSSIGRILIILVLSMATLGVVSAAVAVGSLYEVYQNYADGYVPIEQKLRQCFLKSGLSFG